MRRSGRPGSDYRLAVSLGRFAWLHPIRTLPRVSCLSLPVRDDSSRSRSQPPRSSSRSRWSRAVSPIRPSTRTRPLRPTRNSAPTSTISGTCCSGLGVAVFIFVEGLLFYAIDPVPRPARATPQPEHVHGNTTLEIMWTVIPAIDSRRDRSPDGQDHLRDRGQGRVRARSRSRSTAHQWWWEFRYPQYGVTTANELYLPIGRKVNFALQSRDVLHSFWTPAAGRQARRHLEPHQLSLVHARLDADPDRVQRDLQRVLRRWATPTCGCASSW